MVRPLTTPYRPLNPRPKEKPLRTIYSLSGVCYLVEWICPPCQGRGCKICKHRGCLDGIARAIYDESRIRENDYYPKKTRRNRKTKKDENAPSTGAV